MLQPGIGALRDCHYHAETGLAGNSFLNLRVEDRDAGSGETAENQWWEPLKGNAGVSSGPKTPTCHRVVPPDTDAKSNQHID